MPTFTRKPPLGTVGLIRAFLCHRVGWFVALWIVSPFVGKSAELEVHIATRLGNPATRFADPLKTPGDFQAMLRSETLRADVDFIARESGFQGDMEDLRRAAEIRNIRPLQIPVGKRLPAMSTRKNGQAVLLREVLWAGKEPIDAYEYYFVSQGRRYRVVSPKACANFWVEDAGRDLRAVLALSCDAPDVLPLRRPGRVCLSLTNTGNDVEPLARVTLPMPVGSTFISATGEGTLVGGSVLWESRNLAPGSSHEVCVEFSAAQPATLAFIATATGSRSPPIQSRCQTRTVGIPAVMLEVVDLDDPIEVGHDLTYEITVLNQGTAPLTQLKLTCALEDGQRFVSGTGTTAVRAQDRAITLETLSILEPKGKATWRVVVKTLQAGDVRFATELICDQFQDPIRENEATRQY